MNKTIDFLKTLPENSKQKVEIKGINGNKQYYFMWFLDENKIDLNPVDNINLVTIPKRNWDKINLIF